MVDRGARQIDRHRQVDASIDVPSERLLEGGDAPAQTALARRQHFQKDQPDQDPVALRQEPLHADPAALLAADQDVLLPHQTGDVLEPDRQIEER